MSEQEQIEEILIEANAYGLRNEVEEMAQMVLGLYPDMMDRVSVYNFAYSNIVKENNDER